MSVKKLLPDGYSNFKENYMNAYAFHDSGLE